jgi:hypothetical protein
MGMVSACSTVVAVKDQVSCDLAGETAILGLKAGVYYGLDPVGSRIWNLIQKPIAVADIHKVLLDEYDVDSDRCERDLHGLLQKMVDEGLIEVVDEATA